MTVKNNNDGELVIRTLAMPLDANIYGDIFGGWILSQMDIGGSIAAHKKIKTKAVTVAINSMKFLRPVAIGDVICIYARLIKIGTTSIQYHLKTSTAGKQV